MENQTTTPPPGETYQAQTPPPVYQQSLPNASTVLVLGILSIVLCWCYGIIAIALAIIAIVLANKDLALYRATPAQFTLSSYNNVKAGKTCSVIGLCLSALYIVFIIIYIIIVGFAALTVLPWQMYNT